MFAFIVSITLANTLMKEWDGNQDLNLLVRFKGMVEYENFNRTQNPVAKHLRIALTAVAAVHIGKSTEEIS
jgi:hypothetical protein